MEAARYYLAQEMAAKRRGEPRFSTLLQQAQQQMLRPWPV
jgi:hypothetical protein